MKSQHMLVYGGIVLCLSLLYLIWRGGGVADGFADKGPEFVMYYADWCPHCKVIEENADFKSFLTTPMNIKGKTVNMRMVESKTDEGKAATTKDIVKGYPTFILYKGGSPIEYKGAREIEAIKAFITENV